MKLGSIGSSLVRLFRKSDTSVPPKIDRSRLPLGLTIDEFTAMMTGFPPPSVIGEMLKKLRETGADVAPPRPGIKPPSDITDGWTWSQWSKEASAGGVIPGWAFCRFANRLGEDKVGFVFGHVRGGFGVWQQPFDVFVNSYEGVEQRPDILTCVTHLCTGMGLGIFADRATAITAAELAEKVCPSWQTDTPEQLTVWGENIGRTRTAWHAIGIRESTNANARDRHGTRFPIFGQDNESLMAGKPERLS